MNLDLAKKGEEIALNFLKKKRYKILEKNWRMKFGEIDLVAKDKNNLVFVEVRTKTNEDFGSPEETIDWKKQQKLVRNAKLYATIKKWKGPSRIDAVCIVLDEKENLKRINHYENITS